MIDRKIARACDQFAIEELQVPGLVLMENAGRGCAESLIRRTTAERDRRAVVLCGPGNNGGDGMVIARQLLLAGWAIKVGLLAPPERYRGDAATMLQPLWHLPLELVRADQGAAWEEPGFWQVGGQPAGWIVDALLGTGASGPLRDPLAGLVIAANRQSAQRCAVDVPTGVDCDLPRLPEVYFHPDLTCTFIDRKPGLACLPGEIEVVHIGVHRDWLTPRQNGEPPADRQPGQ